MSNEHKNETTFLFNCRRSIKCKIETYIGVSYVAFVIGSTRLCQCVCATNITKKNYLEFHNCCNVSFNLQLQCKANAIDFHSLLVYIYYILFREVATTVEFFWWWRRHGTKLFLLCVLFFPLPFDLNLSIFYQTYHIPDPKKN